MDLTGKTFETADRKKIRKKILDITQKEQLNARILKATNYHFPCKQYDSNWTKREKKHSDQNC